MRRWRAARAVYRDGPLARDGVHRRGRMCAHAGRGWALAWGGACPRRRTRRYTLCVCCVTWVSSASGGTALWRGGRGAHPRRAAGRPGGTTGCSAWVPFWSSSVSGGVLGGSGKMRNVKSESLPRLATCRASPPRLSGHSTSIHRHLLRTRIGYIHPILLSQKYSLFLWMHGYQSVYTY